MRNTSIARLTWALAFSLLPLLAAAALLIARYVQEIGGDPERARLREMVGQMLMIGFPGTSSTESWPRHVKKMVAKGEIGGVLLLSHNVESPAQLKALTDALMDGAGEIKPFIAIDQEGGSVQRLSPRKGFAGLPAAQTVALYGPSAAFLLYSRQAQELAAQGVTVNLGPVVDLSINRDNPIIARLGRSFGATPEIVMPYARAFIKAHFDHGILTAAKHFPGHGSSATDPHYAAANISGSWTEQELMPFRLLAADCRRVPMIMVGHVVLRGYSDGDAPASLSRGAATEVLREGLGYDGLIITDDLDMAAVRENYSVEDASVKAVAAGNDVIMTANKYSPDTYLVHRITEAIIAAIGHGEIDRRNIERSYERILAAKAKTSKKTASNCKGE
jgi:beta-N-acetylhexosaminidase